MRKHTREKPTLVLVARRAFLRAILDDPAGYATIDDARALFAMPQGVNPTTLGSVPGLFLRKGIVESVGFVKSSRAVAHVRPIQRWRLKDRAAAEKWLVDHPLPEQSDEAGTN